MKKLFIILALFLSACVQPTATPDPYPPAGKPTAYPAAVAHANPNLASPTPAAVRAQVANQDDALNLPVVIKDGQPARPTATATATQQPPTPTNTVQPPTATASVAPPTPTSTTVAGDFPVLPDGGFEAAQWWEYSDAWDGLIVPAASFEGLTWRPFDGSRFMFWGGRDVQEIVSPVGERSLLISDPVAIPAGVPEFYFRVQLLLRSEERMCTPPIDSFRVYIGPSTFRTDWPIDTNTDTLIGVMPLCVANNTWAYTPISVDYDLSRYAGQTIRVKLLVWIDSIDYSHALLDNAEFTTDAPTQAQAFTVQSEDAFTPGFITGDDLLSIPNPDWDEFELLER